MKMSLANSFALLWLAAIIPVVAFYILKVRLRRVPVSTILFWRQIYDENQPRSLWQRMRHWLSLLAQIMLILLLVGALCDPYFHGETRQLRRIVLVIDNSASMNATDVSPNRLTAAKKAARQVISEMRFRDELAIVATGGAPQVVCGFSSHSRTLRSSIDGVSPTDNPTRMSDAIELASRLLGERADEHQREIFVLTDGSSSGSSESATEMKAGEPPTLRYRRFGTNVGNVGITRFQVRRSLIDPLGYEILAEVTNASDEPIECRLGIDLNDEVIDVVPLKLSPEQRWSQSFEKTSADGGHLIAKLDRKDSLAADNQARAVLPKRDLMPVSLVSEGNLFLQKVFESNPLVMLTRVAPVDWKPLSSSHIHQNVGEQKSDVISDAAHSLATAATSAVTVLHRHVPEKLPSGSLLVIDPRGSCDAWQIGEPLQNSVVSQQNKDYSTSLLSHVRLDNVVMPEARQVKFASEEGVKVLARAASGDPLLAIIERPGLKVLLLTVNLDEGDLPLRTAFPILMANALNWFAENRGELREALPTGAITEVELATLHTDAHQVEDSQRQISPTRQRGVASTDLAKTTDPLPRLHVGLVLVAPDGRQTKLPSNSERMSLGPLDQCGIWRVEFDQSEVAASGENDQLATEPLLELACNLMDRGESDVRVPKTDDVAQQPVVTASLFGNRPVWFWLIAWAWFLMAVEWWAYQRRVIE